MSPDSNQNYDFRSFIQHNSTREEIIDRLLAYIEKGPMWRYHSFVRSLHEDGQDHIVTLVGHDPEKYNEVSLSINPCPT